jgi:hypothetical protein
MAAGVGGVAPSCDGSVVGLFPNDCAKALAVKERMAMETRDFFMMDDLYRTSLVQEIDLT